MSAAQILAARERCKAGGASVLDVLLEGWPGPPDALAEQLHGVGGLRALLHADAAVPAWDVLDPEAAGALGAVPVRLQAAMRDDEIYLAMKDPWVPELLSRARRAAGRDLVPIAAPAAMLAAWLGSRGDLHVTPGSRDIKSQRADGPVVQFVAAAIEAGYASGASDIHFECDRHGVGVKHRVDGVMRSFSSMVGQQAAEEVVSRIKVMAQLDITERRLPQDGRVRYVHAAGDLDLRVSIMPSVHGEDAVLRILDKAQLRDQASVSLSDLGFEPTDAQAIRELSNAPSGMLLVTGPTGSGKTTTLYAALSEVNTGLEKIVTIEDPVEYELAGVLQIPVNERKGLTFARGLRSILRHDPDRILIGEIRDAETAEIAVQSALTGHVVFTTVHANSITDVIGRFRHFGLDMFGFMSSLNAIVVQRLLRRVCSACATTRAPHAQEMLWLEQSLPEAEASNLGSIQIADTHGCNQCGGTGFKGRFVLSEVHHVDDAFRDLVTEGTALSALRHHAYSRDVRSLQQRAALRVLQCQTTIAEVRRVVGGN
ncbi:hypothetical protein IP84_06990 [beta proteobacterium AAP99]|nr:hypothetical protein IP84_06990 [beta proteobacterium AAP99]